MAFSSALQDRVNGTVILVNLYLSKTDPAPLLRDLHYSRPIQAYIVHSAKQSLCTDVNFWDRQSDTLGLVLASCEMTFASQVDFPQFGHSPDRRRVYVKPSFPFTGEGTYEQCVCVLLADLHQYIFLYECLKSTNSSLSREHENVDLL